MSSFEYLKNIHADYLKIDGIFVRDIIDNEYDLAIVKSINGIGQTLGLKTAAEFVESQELVDKLTEIGLDYLQGIGISPPPQPIDQLLSTPLKKLPDTKLVAGQFALIPFFASLALSLIGLFKVLPARDSHIAVKVILYTTFLFR